MTASTPQQEFSAAVAGPCAHGGAVHTGAAGGPVTLRTGKGLKRFASEKAARNYERSLDCNAGHFERVHLPARDTSPSERVIIGAVLTDPARAWPHLHGIGPEHFEDVNLRKAFEIAKAAQAKNPGAHNLATLGPELIKACASEAAESAVDSWSQSEASVIWACNSLRRSHTAFRLAAELSDLHKALVSAPDDCAAIVTAIREATERADRDGDSALAAIIEAGAYVVTDPPDPDPIIEGLIEAGDKIGIIAPAKRQKSFLALQLALCVSAGRPFLGWAVPKPRRVLIVQLEIKGGHYHRRTRYVARTLGITADDLGGRLGIVNGRGAGIMPDDLLRLAMSFGADLIIVDPLYKVTEGDENSARDIKPTLAAFDRIATETGAAVLWVHHDAKGAPGERDTRDRGAGSNVLVRDVDQLFTLAPHRDTDGATVLETLARNYADDGPRVIVWEDGAFRVDHSLDAVPESGMDRIRKRNARPPVEDLTGAALDALRRDGPLPAARFMPLLYSLAGTQQRARELKSVLMASGAVEKHEDRGRGRYTLLYGTPNQIRALEAEGACHE